MNNRMLIVAALVTAWTGMGWARGAAPFSDGCYLYEDFDLVAQGWKSVSVAGGNRYAEFSEQKGNGVLHVFDNTTQDRVSSRSRLFDIPPNQFPYVIEFSFLWSDRAVGAGQHAFILNEEPSYGEARIGLLLYPGGELRWLDGQATGAKLLPDKWYTLCIERASAGQSHLYVDGKKVFAKETRPAAPGTFFSLIGTWEAPWVCDFYLDNVKVGRKTNAPAVKAFWKGYPNALENASFELGFMKGWSSYAARKYAPNNLSYLGLLWSGELIDATTAAHGKRSLKLPIYNPTRMPRNPQLMSKLFSAEAGLRYTLSVWMKSDSPGVRVEMGAYTANYEYKGIRRTVTLGRDWQRYAVSGVLPKSPGHGYFVSIKSADAETGPGYFWVDAVQFSKGDLAEFKTWSDVEWGLHFPRRGNQFVGDGPVPLTVVGFNSGRQSRSETLTVNVYDVGDRQVGTWPVSVRIPGQGGSESKVNLAFPCMGAFRAELIGSDHQTVLAEELFNKIYPARRRIGNQGSVFGVHTQFHEHTLSVLSEAGFSAVRDLDCSLMSRWDAHLPGGFRGVTAWEFDDEVDTARRHGFDRLTTLLSSVENFPYVRAVETTGELRKELQKYNYRYSLNDWRKWVRDMFVHYRGKVKYWEVLNEPDTWIIPDHYVEVLKIAYEEARKADPANKVVGVVSQQPGINNYVKGVFKAGGGKYMDIASFHAYNDVVSGTRGSEDAMAGFTAGVRKLGFAGPVWMTEAGIYAKTFYRHLLNVARTSYTEGDCFCGGHWTARQTAVWMPKPYILALAVGVEKYFYYAAWNNRDSMVPDGQDMFEYSGVLKPMGVAVSFASHMLTNATFVRRIPVADTEERCFLFDRQGVPIVTIWSEAAKPHVLAIPETLSQCRFYDYMGNKLAAGAGLGSLQLKSSVTYIEGPAGTAGKITAFLENDSFSNQIHGSDSKRLHND